MPEIPILSPCHLEKSYQDKTTLQVSGDSLRALLIAATTLTELVDDSADFKEKRNSLRGRVCIGHIHKAIKLSMAAMNLAISGKHGEGINHLAYQCFNVSVQGIWLGECSDQDFDLYMNLSLRSEKEGYDELLKYGSDAEKELMLPMIKEVFESAGLDIEKFVPADNSMPTIKSMIRELKLGQQFFGLHEMLGYHQARTTYVELSRYYLDDTNELSTFKHGHMYPKAYHLSAIGLPLCTLLVTYVENVFEDDDVKSGLREYFDNFKNWLEELNEFLLKRIMQADPLQVAKPKERHNFETPLSQHRFVKKELITPLNRLGVTSTSWYNDRLPQVLWAMTLIKSLGRERALKIFRQVINLFFDQDDTIDGDITFEGILRLPDGLKEKFFAILNQDSEVVRALSHLQVLDSVPGIGNWPKQEGNDPSGSWDFIAQCVGMGVDHQSQESTDCRWLKLACRTAAGKMHFPEKRFYEEIFLYPDYGDQKAVRPSIRANEMSLEMFDPNSPQSTWIRDFWSNCYKNTRCIGSDNRIPTHRVKGSKLTLGNLEVTFNKLRGAYTNHLPTTYIEPKHDSLMGLALFATTVAMQIINSAENDVLGIFGLRVIAEVTINLKYLNQRNDEELWKKFRDYGVGKAKLTSLKFDDSEEPPSYLPLEKLKLIANEDQWQEFLNIDLGDWSKEDLRTRSIQSGTKDIYDKYYEWPSTFIHGQWGAIRYFLFENCINPLHRFHRLAKSPLAMPTVKYDVEILLKEIFDIIEQVYPDVKITLGEEAANAAD